MCRRCGDVLPPMTRPYCSIRCLKLDKGLSRVDDRYSSHHPPSAVIRTSTRSDEYRLVHYVDGTRELEHRAVVRWSGVDLLPGEVVHHKNHDRGDNRIENLAVKESQAIHAAGHGKKCKKGCTCGRHKGGAFTSEHRQRISEALKGREKSAEHLANIRKAKQRKVNSVRH